MVLSIGIGIGIDFFKISGIDIGIGIEFFRLVILVLVLVSKFHSCKYWYRFEPKLVVSHSTDTK